MRGWTRACAGCGETITQFGSGRPRKWCAACCQANYLRRRELYNANRRERTLSWGGVPRKPAVRVARPQTPRCASCRKAMVALPADGLCGLCRVRLREARVQA